MSPDTDRDCTRCGPADLESVVATLVDSRRDYAWERWALPADGRQRLGDVFRASLALIAFPFGRVWSAAAVDSVAVWVPTDVGSLLDDETGSRLAAVTARALGDRAAVVDEVESLVAAVSVPAAQWHLATMGTRSSKQGQGLGAAVLAPMLDRMDRRGEAARLETSSERNVAFYRRSGFDVVAEMAELPHGAPPVWVMHRTPR